MDNINVQAIDEVRELLKDLVVLPVSNDFGKKISNVVESLSELKKELDDFDRFIKGLEPRLLRNIEQKLDNVLENIDECKIDCNNIKKKAEKVDVIETTVSDLLLKSKDTAIAFSTIIELIRNVEKSLSIDVNSKMKEGLSAVKACQSVYQEDKRQIFEDIQRLHKEIESANLKIDEFKTILYSLNGRTGNIEKDISAHVQGVSQIINDRCDTLSRFVDGIGNSFNIKVMETSEEHTRLYKQSKNSFLILIILSMFNLIGLICLIMFNISR